MSLFSHDIFLLTKVYILHIMESVRENLIFEIGLLFFIHDERRMKMKDEYLTQSGDIIMRLTAPYTAVLIDETTAGMVISSNFVVIRTENGLLLPEYLFWLLNTQNMKRKIYENATSNMLGSVKATFLMDLELTVLPLEHQRRIARLNLLAKKEERLLKELADEKEKLYDILLNQAYKSAKKGK